MRRTALVALLLAACSEGRSDLPPDGGDDGFADAAPQADSVRADARRPADATPPDAADPPPRYPAEADSPYSPITPSVKRNIEAIVLRGPTLKDDEFIKVGDSITVSDAFVKCFATDKTDLAGYATELQGTLDHFNLAATNPYSRVSLAAKVGVSAPWALTGSPPPLEQETGAMMPRYAVVMYGSNDVANGANYIYTFGPTMLDIVDRLAAQGIVPIMSTFPPNTDATLNERIPRFNAVVRAIAQARQLPLMEYHRELLKLPMLGLGPDGLHPSSFPGGACKLTTDGLAYGYNLRNLLTLKSLDRARSVVEGDPAPDPPAAQPAVRGEGSYVTPFEINSFPWSDMHDTSLSTNTMINKYDAAPCSATQNESGPEYVYRLVVNAPVKVRAMVFDDGDTDIDLHLLSGGTTADKCVQRNDREIVATLPAGTHYFILDTFVPMSTGVPATGEYLFLIMEEP